MAYSVIVAMTGVFAAALLRGFTGFGFGMAAVPLLSLALPPASVVPLVVVLQVVISVSGLRQSVGICAWRTIWELFPGLILGVPIGLTILTVLPAGPVRLVIGVLIIMAVMVLRRGVRLPPRPSRLVTLTAGLISGTTNGLASMGGPPVMVYLLAVGLSAARIRATAMVYFMLAGCVSAAPMAARGMIGRQTLIWAAASLPVLFTGARLGGWMFNRAGPEMHRRAALCALSVLAALLIVRGVLG